MSSLNTRDDYEETELTVLNETDETVEEAQEKCCGSSSPARARAPRTHQISESKSVRVEPSVICQVTDDVYAFRDDSSTERLCKVLYNVLKFILWPFFNPQACFKPPWNPKNREISKYLQHRSKSKYHNAIKKILSYYKKSSSGLRNTNSGRNFETEFRKRSGGTSSPGQENGSSCNSIWLRQFSIRIMK